MDYSRFTFPPYTFVEFPKWVRAGERAHLVQDAQEEAAILQAPSTTPADTRETPARRGRPPKAQS